MTPRNRNLFWILFLIASGLVIRLLFIGSAPLAVDEPFTVFHAQKPVQQLIASLRGDNNPPLFELILHFWMELFGNSETAVRMPSTLFSTAGSVVIFLIGLRHFNFRVGVLASALSLFSVYQLNFAHEARVYALFGLLSALSILFTLDLLKSGPSRSRLIALVLLNTLLMYGHYFGIFVVALQAGIVLLSGRSKPLLLKRYFFSLGVVAVLYAPYIPEVLSRFLFTSSKGTWLAAVSDLGQLHELLHYFSNKSTFTFVVMITVLYSGAAYFLLRFRPFGKIGLLVTDLLLPVFLLTGISIFLPTPLLWMISGKPWFLALFVLGILVVWMMSLMCGPKEYLPGRVVVSCFLFPLLFYFGVSFFFPIFLDRYLMFITPAFFLVLALIIDSWFPGKKGIPASIALLGAFIISFDPSFNHNRHTDELAASVAELKGPSTAVFVCPQWFFHSFLYYYDRSVFEDHANWEQRSKQAGIYFVYHKDEIRPVLETGKYTEVIYVDAYAWAQLPENGIEAFLKEELSGPDPQILPMKDGMHLLIKKLD